MKRVRLAIYLFGAAAICGALLLFVSDATIVPLAACGTGPGGVQVTTGGWAAFFASLLATCGFSLSGLIVAIADVLKWPAPPAITPEPVSEAPFVSQVVELTESFSALLLDRESRAAQRRFVFALVDSAGLIQGCQTSHDNGVIVIRYSGYADPVHASLEGATT